MKILLCPLPMKKTQTKYPNPNKTHKTPHCRSNNLSTKPATLYMFLLLLEWQPPVWSQTSLIAETLSETQTKTMNQIKILKRRLKTPVWLITVS